MSRNAARDIAIPTLMHQKSKVWKLATSYNPWIPFTYSRFLVTIVLWNLSPHSIIAALQRMQRVSNNLAWDHRLIGNLHPAQKVREYSCTDDLYQKCTLHELNFKIITSVQMHEGANNRRNGKQSSHITIIHITKSPETKVSKFSWELWKAHCLKADVYRPLTTKENDLILKVMNHGMTR